MFLIAYRYLQQCHKYLISQKLPDEIMCDSLCAGSRLSDNPLEKDSSICVKMLDWKKAFSTIEDSLKCTGLLCCTLARKTLSVSSSSSSSSMRTCGMRYRSELVWTLSKFKQNYCTLQEFLWHEFNRCNLCNITIFSRFWSHYVQSKNY